MSIIAKGCETYMYLNGIKPRDKIALDNGITFESVRCNPSSDDIVKNCESEVDIGVACIFLRSVSSYFHVVANTQHQLAVKSWNAQWDAILLGALCDCEVGINFQSDVSPANISQSKAFRITNYALKGLNGGKVRRITESEHKWINKNYSKAKFLMDNDKYMNAVHAVSTYGWHSMPRAQLALIWSGIEGLFGIDSELSFRLGLYVSKYMSPASKEGQRKIIKEVKKLYSIRSKAVHGGKFENQKEAVKASLNLLRRLVKKCAEKGELPKLDSLVP